MTSLVASCKKNDNNNSNSIEDNGFRAQTEIDNGESRTYLDGTTVLWSSGDQILVANQGGEGTTLTYSLKGGSGTTEGDFSSSSENDAFFQPNYVAIYPAKNALGESNSISGTTATFVLPSTQTFKPNSFAQKSMPMVAYSESQTLQFKNVLGGVCFPIKGAGLVTKIVLTSKIDEPLWGTCTTTISTTGGAPTSTVANTGAGMNSITLDCGAGVAVGTNAKDFFIMVPEGTLASGFDVKVYGGEEVLYQKEANAGTISVGRNHVWKLESDIEIDDQPEGALNGTFTVNEQGDKILFAIGSLRYNPYQNIWRFAEPQYNLLHPASHADVNNQVDVSNEYTATYDGWIELFGWGCTGMQDTEHHENQDYYLPYETREYDDEYNWLASHYGPTGEYDLSVANKSDWGAVDIQNGGEGGWRLWDIREAQYMLNSRETESGIRFAWAQIGDPTNDFYDAACGVIILPDEWDSNLYPLQHYNTFEEFYLNQISIDDWENILEANGVMFMITPGGRRGTTLYEPGSTWGWYWSKNAYGIEFALMPNGIPGQPLLQDMYQGRCYGGIVRLVRDL